MSKAKIIFAFIAVVFIYAACFDEEQTDTTTQTERVYDQDNPNTWQQREWTADDLPMVHLQDRTRYVCDPEGIMQQVYRDSADMVLANLEKNYQIESVFVIVSHVKGGDTFRMAQDIGNKYGVGRKETNRGLVMVIAVEDHESFIAPGRGLEGDLTDLLCGRIGDTYISGNMRKGDPDHAVLQTCQVIGFGYVIFPRTSRIVFSRYLPVNLFCKVCAQICSAVFHKIIRFSIDNSSVIKKYVKHFTGRLFFAWNNNCRYSAFRNRYRFTVFEGIRFESEQYAGIFF